MPEQRDASGGALRGSAPVIAISLAMIAGATALITSISDRAIKRQFGRTQSLKLTITKGSLATPDELSDAFDTEHVFPMVIT